MIECAVTQDILKYKAKFIGNFSTREIVCIGLGASAALLNFFVFMGGVEKIMTKVYVSAIVAVPFLLFGFAMPLGQPLEKILWQIIYDNFICPSIRKKEINYPEYEKFRRNEFNFEKMQTEEVSEKDSKKKKKAAKSNAKAKNKKIAKSKEYKGIR